MLYPEEFIEFLVHYHGDRDYFECHEILEEYWKKVDRENKHSVWVGFIQLAVAHYHHRRGNFTGAYRTLQKSLHIFLLRASQLNQLGIDKAALLKQINLCLFKMEHHQNYESTNLPITSNDLIQQCLQRCHELHMEWCSKSDLTKLEIVHRHQKRDRTQVIKERNQALVRKQTKETNSKKKE